MAFCNLPDGQKAALFFLESIDAAPSPGKFDRLKQAVAHQNWELISTIASLVNDNAPTTADFQAVGSLPQGVQNAYFVLALVDAQGTPDAKTKLFQALETCCWDHVAGQIVNAITTTGVTFTGADLHQAYAPNNTQSCQKPSGFDIFIGKLITDGKLVGNFFSSTLPNFFENDFSHFFTGTISNFFTGPFVDFFKNFGDSLKDGFEGLGNTLEQGLSELGGKLNPSNW